MAKRGKESPTSAQVRRQVDQVMDRWSSYTSFAALFDELLNANAVSTKEFVRDLADYGRAQRSSYNVREFRVGEREPPYDFVEDLLTTNLLHLDPQRIRPEHGDQPSGDQRVAMFAAAGFIEVTPASVREWNREVLAGHRRFVEANTGIPRPRWGDVMAKLLSFHLQGGRRIIRGVAEEIHAYADAGMNLTPERIASLLCNSRAANDQERAALYRYVQLDNDQIAAIEEGIATGLIPLGHVHQTTPLTQALNDILDKLASQGVSMNQFAQFSQTLNVPGGSAVRQSDLSSWRLGRSGLTLQKLRSLTSTIEHYGPDRLRNPVTTEELDRLVLASGFQVGQLTDTTHDIAAKINDNTKITSLLQALREAVDIAISPDDICRIGAERGYNVPTLAMLGAWERPDNSYPTGRQVRNLLEWYNQLITENNCPPLSQDEISRVVEVAERDFEKWQRQSHAEKLAERKPVDRRHPPSPTFELPDRSR